MSIILNALNKKQGKPDMEDTERLIETDIDENEITFVENAPRDHRLFFLLVVIVALLVVIIGLLLWEKLSSDSKVQGVDGNQSTNQTHIISEEKPIKNTQQMNNEVQVSNEVQVNSETQVNSDIQTNKEQFLESYQLEKNELSKKVFKTKEKPNNKVSSDFQNKATHSTKTILKKEEQKDEQKESLDKKQNIVSYSELNDEMKFSVLSVRIDALIYSKNPENSFIFYGKEMKKKGDLIVDGWYLQDIEKNAVIIKKDDLIVRKLFKK